MARSWVQATMPHSKPTEDHFTRENGYYTLTMKGHPNYGLPYGSIPRLLLSWLTTEAVRTRPDKTREIELGPSLNNFMKELGLKATGGKNGTITSLKDQMKRLFTCSISLVEDDKNHFKVENLTPIDEANLWWSTKDPEEMSLFSSNVILGEKFYKEIINKPVVFRLATLKLLKQSSMAVDLYIWITYKNSYSYKTTYMKWDSLQFQFGAGYPFTSQGKRNFKRMFIETLKKVAIAYPEAARLKIETDRLVFIPGQPDIPKLYTVR